jgi:hypothetical protein
MKKNILSVMIICFGVHVYAQKQEYKTKLDIPYYSESINKSDSYINERCVLDIFTSVRL